MLYCIIPLVLLMLAVVFLRRNEGLTRGAKLLYLIVFWLEIPGSIVRGGFSYILIAAALTPLWIIFALIAAINWGINYLNGHPAPPINLGFFFFVLGVAIVSIGSLVWVLDH